MRKSGESLSEYVRQKRQLQNNLKNTARKLTDDDLIDIILVGVHNQFESVVGSLEHKSYLTLDLLRELLENAEEARCSKKAYPARVRASTPRTICDHCRGKNDSANFWKSFPQKKPAEFKKINDERQKQAPAHSVNCNTPETDSDYVWPADSGCTHNMSGSRQLFRK